MKLIEREPASHWYLRDGRPFHEVAKKDGTGNRPTNVADARKVRAVPSVTNVLGVLAKPGLDAWKIEQGIIAALTLPRRSDEPLDAFARRVVVDMGEQVERAADFGSAVHAACEVYARTRELPEDVTLLGFMEAWQVWFEANVEEVREVERVCVNPGQGYAGRVVLVAKLRGVGWAVVDFKTQRVKRSALGVPVPAFYETWPLQLAAYRQAIAVSWEMPQAIEAALVSVVIDSAQPGPMHVRVWEEDGGGRMEDGFYGAFLAALDLWRYVKAYDPRGQRTEDGGQRADGRAQALTA